MPPQPYSNSIFWVEVEKISPNPYQPRREFDIEKLKELFDSIRQYGILQPLVVSRKEVEKDIKRACDDLKEVAKEIDARLGL